MRKPRRTRIRERAEELLPECRHPSEAYVRAAREIRDAERPGGAPEPVTGRTVREASRRLFSPLPLTGDVEPVEITEEDLEEAASRLFPGRGLGDLRGQGR